MAVTIADNVFFDDPKCKGLNCSDNEGPVQKHYTKCTERHEEHGGEGGNWIIFMSVRGME